MPSLSIRSATGRARQWSITTVALYAVLIVIALVQLFPLYWLLTFSLKNNQQIFSSHPLSFPFQPRWENYEKVWNVGNIGTYFLNSVWITVVATVVTLLIASFATYAITRMNWKGSKLVLGVIMVAMMIPVHSTLIPLYSMFNAVNLIDNPFSILLSYIAFNLPITVLIMLGFYYTIPREIEEAAIMDGSSVNRLVLTIIFPMTGSVVATTGIVNMIYNWNEFIFVNTFISSNELKTLTVGVQNFIGQYTTDWGAIGATLMISILPILLAFLFLSDQIVEGLAAGSIKG
ncbi:carbohydrate ABC transporter permease [Paenibacillus septentrionalis]|uniref:Carbohydrate ABC transporter permease n=1 Tax=Paenibacillus septentrionalis TaxID=429342 RepID=A0ABW1V6I0_9BACL